MQIMKVFIFVFAFLAVVSGDELFARKWTDKSGKSIEAEFVRFDDAAGKIVLKNSKGKEVSISVKSLSEADQLHIASLKSKDDPAADTLLDNEPGYEGLTIVIADGYGETIAEAKKDALQSAVSEVVGSLVDAESRVTNDELIENILTASNAYVGKHRVLSTKKEDGVYHVQIKAGVAQKSLTMKLSATKSTKKIDGASLAGMVETSVKSENDATLLFAKFLKDESFPYSLMDVELSEPRVVKRGETVTLEFDYTCQANMEKYAEFVKKISPILENISSKSATFMMEAKKDGKIAGMLIYDPSKLPGQEEGKHYICLCTEVFNNFQSTKWQAYEIPKKVKLPVIGYSMVMPVAEISFKDKEKKLITVKRMVNGIGAGYIFGREREYREDEDYKAYNLCGYLTGKTEYDPTPYCDDSESQKGSQIRHLYGTPSCDTIVFGLGPFYFEKKKYREGYAIPTATRKIQVTLTKEELGRLDTTEVALIPDNPDMDKFYKELPAKLQEMDK